MPNWCFSTIKVDGPEAQLRKLYDTMNHLEGMDEPLVDSDFGPSWYGCLVHALGGNWEKVYCRGSWNDVWIEGDDDDVVVAWYDESAWCPMTELFAFIEQAFPGIKIYYQSEEEGSCVFETNDVDGKYFPERYYFRTPEETRDYVELDDVLSFASRILGRPVTSEEQLVKEIRENENLDWYFARYVLICG